MGLIIQQDILVVGGGAAGLMAAYGAASTPARPLVTVLEKMPRPGRKIMITGKGRCNFTNCKAWNDFSVHIRSGARFLRPAFYNLPPEAVVRLIEDQGFPTVVEHGDRAFPASYHASDIVDALCGAAGKAGAKMEYGAEVRSISHEDELFIVRCKGGRTFAAPRLILATGGLSYPRTGSTGDGYAWAAGFGHSVKPCFPSLTALVPRGYKDLEAGPSVGRIAAKVLAGEDPASARGESVLPPGYPSPKGHIPRETPLSEFGMLLQGVSLRNVTLTLGQGQDILQSETGEVAFTDGGLEGPLGFSVSRDCVKCILSGGKPWISLDLKPGVDPEDLTVRIKGLWDEIGKDPRSRGLRIPAIARVLLGKLMPREVLEAFLQAHPSILSGRRGNERLDFRALTAALKDWRMPIEGYVGYERCVVTAGGVSLDEVLPKTMESRLQKGLYLCGELLDIDADTGGYNLQLAFSTGYLAGQSAGKAV